MDNVIIRLKRLEGQLAKVRKQIADGADCAEVLTQLLAVRGALNASIQTYTEESLAACAGRKSPEEQALLIKTLIKKL